MKKTLIVGLSAILVAVSIFKSHQALSQNSARPKEGGYAMDTGSVITKIRSVAVNVSDHDKAYDFYVNKLGFEVQGDQITEDGYFWLTVLPKGSDTPIALAPPPPGKAAGGFTQIVFATENIEASYKKMKAEGIKFTQAPEKQDWGGILAQFSD
ncbi:VOC family protein, partial [bacterium]|nr:VOC family protein [bacterium]